MSDEKVTCDRGPVACPKTAGFSVPEELVVPARFTEQEQAPPGVPVPPPAGTVEVPEWVQEHEREIDDHLRDIRQGLLTITAELDQIGQSTQALMSSRLYWVEFTETADGPDFASELAEVGTKVRHLQRILAAAEGRSTP